MVEHASEYPWSYGYNGSGKVIDLITLHQEYLRLGKTDAERGQ